MLVKIRPGWEEIRSYLTPTGDHQRSFDVYACTKAEHELTMEMWRLLDPQFELIASSQLHSQIMCLKANSCRSLQDIFHYRQCHPKMSLVIDNRVDVWDEKDQSRVHVVPTFSPYSTTQEEVEKTFLFLFVCWHCLFFFGVNTQNNAVLLIFRPMLFLCLM